MKRVSYESKHDIFLKLNIEFAGIVCLQGKRMSKMNLKIYAIHI